MHTIIGSLLSISVVSETFKLVKCYDGFLLNSFESGEQSF